MLLQGSTPLTTLRKNKVTHRYYSTEGQMNTYVVWGGIGKVFPLLPLFYFVSKSYMCNYIVPTGTKAPRRMFINDWERGRGK